MPIYTRTGDDGTTALFGGARVSKDDIQVETYGAIDELISHIGLVLTYIEHPQLHPLFLSIQSDLLSVGASLAGNTISLNSLVKQEKEMEQAIDLMETHLPPLHLFLLPGGSEAAAHIHIARSVARRAERQVIRLSKIQTVSANIIPYLNRLSDLLFVTARYINTTTQGKEYTWKAGKIISGKEKIQE